MGFDMLRLTVDRYDAIEYNSERYFYKLTMGIVVLLSGSDDGREGLMKGADTDVIRL